MDLNSSNIAALSSAMLPVAGGFLSAASGRRAQKDAFKYNMKMAEYQYDKNLEMWNLNNDYNSPLAQRQRMEAAGFNPNLVYGHGSVVNTSSSVPQYSAPQMQAYTNYPNLGEAALQGLLNLRANVAQVKKSEADTELVKAEARRANVEADAAEEYGLDNAGYDSAKKRDEASLVALKKEYEDARSFWYDQLISNEVNLSNQQLNYILEKIKYTQKQIDKLDSDIEVNRSQVDLNTANAGLSAAKTATERLRPLEVSADISYKRAMRKVADEKRWGEFWDNLKKEQTLPYIVQEHEQTVRRLASEVISIGLKNKLSIMQTSKLFYETVSAKTDADFAVALKSAKFWEFLLRSAGYALGK